MDITYRNKSRQASRPVSATSAEEKKHVSDDYDPKLRPRQTHPDTVDNKKRIKGNLKQLNRRLAELPVPEENALEIASQQAEDNGAKIVTQATAVSRPIPFAMILSIAVLLFVFMYTISLHVQVEEYSHSIDAMDSRIAELKEEATRLEVQLESKYDLDEIERIATQEYGMVVSSTLPKKYISVSSREDIWQETEQKEEEPSFFEEMLSGVRTFFGKGEE